MSGNPFGAPGEVHEFTFDVETQGLRTRSFTKRRYEGRPLSEPIGISSIAYGRAGKKAHVNAYTDLITPDLLHRHQITEEMLNEGILPDSLFNEVVRDANSRSPYNPSAPPRWDPSLRTRGSIIDGVFRRHAKHVLKGEGVLAQRDVYQGLVNEWSGIATAGGKVSLGAWNVGYDMPTLFREMRRHGFSTEIDSLLKSNTMQVREMAEGLHAMRFEAMLKSNYTPVMTNRAAAQAAVDIGISSVSPEKARSLGAIVEHKGLRDFMDDVYGNNKGLKSFHDRATKWANSQRAGSAQAQAVAEDLTKRLSGVHDWAAFKEFVEYGHRNSSTLIYGEKTLNDVVGEMYGSTLGHAHIFGDTRTLNSTLRYAPAAGKFSAFSFIGGGKLQDVSGALVKHAKELDLSEGAASEITKLMTEAHSADADRTLMERTAVELDRIRRDSGLFERWTKIDQVEQREASERRVGELFQDILQGKNAPQRSAADELSKVLHGGGNAMKNAYKKAGHTNVWLMAGLAAAGAYMIGKHNQTEKPPEIEGMRRPKGQYDTIEGINASDLPFSNISAFGSGYDNYVGQQQQPQRVKITKVLDGDTIQFYRGNRLVTGRLAGVDTPETVNRHKLVQKGGREASKFLKDLLHGQEVWIRPQMNDSMDTYGRELLYVDFNGMSVNSEIVRKGHSGALAYIPTPYFDASETGSYLMHRMKVGAENVLSMVQNFFASDDRGNDPFMWSALGTVATLTGEDDLQNDGNPEHREQQVGYGGLAARRFRESGYAGFVQQLSDDAIGHAIRDHATQLHRFPGMPRTSRGRHSHGMVSHAERNAIMGA